MSRIRIQGSPELATVARLFLLEELLNQTESGGRPGGIGVEELRALYAKDTRVLFRQLDAELRDAGYVPGVHTLPQPVMSTTPEADSLFEVEWHEKEAVDQGAAVPLLWQRSDRTDPYGFVLRDAQGVTLFLRQPSVLRQRILFEAVDGALRAWDRVPGTFSDESAWRAARAKLSVDAAPISGSVAFPEAIEKEGTSEAEGLGAFYAYLQTACDALELRPLAERWTCVQQHLATARTAVAEVLRASIGQGLRANALSAASSEPDAWHWARATS